MCTKSSVMIQILIVTATLTVTVMTSFGEYILVDRDAPRDTEGVIAVRSGDKKVEFHDRGDRKVFEVAWDASGRILIVKGDNVYLHIHSTGKIEKLTTVHDNQNQNTQHPVTIQPIVPLYPRQPAIPATPGTPSTAK